jgi:hypothetical protein
MALKVNLMNLICGNQMKESHETMDIKSHLERLE